MTGPSASQNTRPAADHGLQICPRETGLLYDKVDQSAKGLHAKRGARTWVVKLKMAAKLLRAQRRHIDLECLDWDMLAEEGAL